MIRRELSLFLVVGVLTVAVDFTVYHALLRADAGASAAKATGFITGTVFAYFANRGLTFGHTKTGHTAILRFVPLYALTLGANVLINNAALDIFAGFPQHVQLAFLLATGVSACLNFIGMKFFVFKSLKTGKAGGA